MSQAFESGLLGMLPEKRPPWKEFVFSVGAQGVAVWLLAWVGVFHPEVLVPPGHDYHFVQLVNTPVPVDHEPAPVRVIQPPLRAHLAEPSPDALRVPAEIKAKTRAEDPLVAPKVQASASKTLPLAPAAPVIPRQLVKTNVFSTGSSATPTIANAPQQVQTGGFGDPNGVPARDGHGKPVTIAALGSFDLPSGPGYGNRTGGERGARSVVASTGFGNGVATGDGSGRANISRGTVRQSGFGDAEPASTAQLRPKPADLAAAKLIPAEIISKPTPVYTPEARKLHVEGEVLLEVVFESSGKLRILRVVQGLGHGLDEAAVRAAEQIRFKPALQGGQPADCTAVVHIVFQLA
jgi:TonB family protein